ncbi:MULTISPECIES: GntR family transcriptional regulator [Pseudomonas syringae group]|uniref:GntR family transcriptional regulator n=4 Tax=Pseudomonas syringae group TaxID=136849 RepID=A0AA40TTD2_9PSED|nr:MULTISPECIES: GntR family transcriptional regulator [Pseudomonas syringae group]KOP52885.1 GntR family transcriptional regulator [Pseudomonas coronafaciens pv. porri]KOP54798.1 GntR family transcriptional regulator [Pseudomonas coronafaciens pv. porri]KPX32712.1 GntR family transcriptional regulator [Pseudomonas coronafaciens pv. garcae]KPY16151.1 GntR family transcriptional regulator [Pseudomonas coronafaciens pv. porri]KPY94340.1 Transcriptional regulator GntR [Pseudomonas tremae]
MNPPNTTNALAEDVYRRLKQEIFDFYLLPYDRFTETQLADRYQVSRTPVRDALYRLQREGYLDVEFRRGWSVRPLDFNQIDQLYDLRIVLECAAIERICASADVHPELTTLREHWLIDRDSWQTDMQVVADLDEQFHTQLVAASGNLEMARIHQEVTERIRIVRRLDFFKSARIEHTYLEHAAILNALQARKRDEALLLLRSHVEISKLEVRKLTISMLSDARRRYEA